MILVENFAFPFATKENVMMLKLIFDLFFF